jgi:Protein of unknown function (DUF3485)
MNSPSLSTASISAPAVEETSSGLASPATPAPIGQVPIWRSAFVLSLTLLVILAYYLNPPLNVAPQAGVVMDLPVIVGDYFGKEGGMSDAEKGILPADTEMVRRSYDDGKGRQITTTIVLSGAEQRSIHRPEGCLTGQGWTIVGQDNIPVSLPNGHDLIARKLSLERQVTGKDGQPLTVRAFYIYWFVGQGVTTPSHLTRILLSNWDRAVYNKAHRWAYVSLFSLVTDNLRIGGLNSDQTQSNMVDFAKQIVPTFQISEMPAQAKN